MFVPIKAVFVAAAVVIGLIAAVIVGAVTWNKSGDVLRAVRDAGGTFAGVVTVSCAVVSAVA
jgi:hypothetical protein